MKPACDLLPRLVCIVATLPLFSPEPLWSQPSNCVPSPPGLISWWRAETNANDASGANNGVLNGSVSFVAGRVGQAFSFNGINADVRVAAATSLNVGLGDGFTIETWINPASVAEQRPLVEWNNGAYGVNLWLQDTNSGGSGLVFNVTDTGLQDHVLSTAAGTITGGSYRHIAATYDKTNGLARLYINGVMAAHSSVGTFTPRTIGNLYLGLRPAGPGAGFRFQGSMDEVSLYGRALSVGEVQAIYQAGGAGKCTAPSAPMIIVQPTNQTVVTGANATFTLTALGTAPLAYQWLFNGTNILGAAGDILVITNVQSSNTGPYSAIVTNLYGAATSTVALLTIGTPLTCLPLPAGIISWWRAEGNAQDQLGNSPGTLANQAGFGSGKVGQAFAFDGSGDVVRLTNSSPFQVQDFTIECWIRRANASIASFGVNGHGAFFGYGSGGYIFFMDAQGKLLLGKTGIDGISSSMAVTDLVDHHVAVTKSGGSVTFYIDGLPELAPAYNSTFTFTTPAAIGGRGDDFGNSFYGAIDELAVYNRALSTNEIQAIFQAGSAGKCEPPCVPPPAGLVSWWPGDGNAADVAGTNNGTFLNGAVYSAGKVGQSFSFSGGNNHVRIPASPSLNIGTGNGLTIEAWINPADSGQLPILEWVPGGGGYGAMLWINVQSTGSVFADLFDPSGSDHLIQSAAGVITNNGFQHVAVTYDKLSGLARIFVNGAMITESSLGSFTVGTSADLYIGYRPATAPFGPIPFNGLIDEVALYSRALSHSEIQTIYQAGSAGKCVTPSPPFIAVQPASKTVEVGDNASVGITVLGTPPLAYQWRFNGTNISGATNTTFTLNNVQFTNAGNYSVVVTNLYGSTTSSNAVLTVSSAPPCSTPPAGLVSWWRAEASGLDSVGINHGVLLGNASYGSGRAGQAFVFDGSGDAVLLGTPVNLQLQNFTIETWIKRISALSTSLDHPVFGNLFCWGNGGYALGLQSDGQLYLSKVGISSVGVGNAVTDTNWHHVAVTKSGSTVIFYVDGLPHSVAAYDPGFSFSTPLAIGAHGGNLAASFYGAIDELAVYGRPLDGAEIQAIYNASVSGKCVVPVPPTIVAHPQNATVLAGVITSFSVVASGSTPLNYQWQFNGTNIPNATASTLTLNNVQFTNAGNYSVQVTNVAGSAISSNALLTVNLPTPVVRIGSTNVMAGTRFTLPVTLAANGNENALGFSLTFNTQRLSLASVDIGSGAAGATMLVNSSLVWTGRVGIALAYPPQSTPATFRAGTQEVARLTFYSYPVLGAVPPSTVALGDQPVLRELLNLQLQPITANYNNGTVTLLPTIFESDVSPRPGGNQAVSTSDWLQTARFAARLDTPTSSTEFQRADSAPRASLGDGQLKVTDWVQAGRYLGGLDPLLAIGGPTNEVAPVLTGPSANRLLRVVHTNVLQGESTTVAVLLDAQGDENAVGFTISFDPVAIEFAGVALGDNAATGTLQSNPAQAGAGRIGIALALPTGTTFSPGPKEILRFTFSASSASASSFPITITDQIVTRCVSDVLAWELPVSFVNGTLTIDPILTSPLIAISPSGTDVVLTWPLAAANFTLQSLDSTNGLSGNWSNTPVTLQTNGNTVVATLPATNESRFFRLIYP